jgi:hypothetical protein
MKRFMFNLVNGMSLLLGVATAVLWVRSYFVQPLPSMYSDRWLYDEGYAAIYKGEFTFVYYDTEPRPTRWFQTIRIDTQPLVVSQWMGGSGWNNSWWYTSVNCRIWLLTLLALVVPSIWLVRFVRARSRTVLGHCPVCGYDLRATPDRCPECGNIPTVVNQ